MSDTPTLLANASAGQLLGDATTATGIANGQRIRTQRECDSLLRLAELARAVAVLCNPERTYYVEIRTQPDGFTEFGGTDVITLPAVLAALASTRHTQGEADVQAR